MKYFRVFGTVFVLGSYVFLAGCNKSSSEGGTSNALSEAMGILAAAAPTARTSSRRMEREFQRADLAHYGERLVLRDHLTLFADPGLPPAKPLNENIAALKANLNETDPTVVAGKVVNPTLLTRYSAPCYGPLWTDNATGS